MRVLFECVAVAPFHHFGGFAPSVCFHIDCLHLDNTSTTTNDLVCDARIINLHSNLLHLPLDQPSIRIAGSWRVSWDGRAVSELLPSLEDALMAG